MRVIAVVFVPRSAKHISSVSDDGNGCMHAIIGNNGVIRGGKEKRFFLAAFGRRRLLRRRRRSEQESHECEQDGDEEKDDLQGVDRAQPPECV